MSKQVYAKHLGHYVNLGCKPASAEKKAKVLKFSDYHVGDLPTAPKGPLGYTSKSQGRKNVLLNDRLGICVISAYYHIKCCNTSLTGIEFIPTDTQLVSDYGFIGGYDGTPQSDQGCDIPTAIDWYLKKGDQAGTKILGYLTVDARNLTLCRQLIYCFGNLYGGVGLPDDWVDKDMPEADGFVWDVAGSADWNNGHCIPFLDYDMDSNHPGLNPDTWALLGTVTDAAVAEYFGPKGNGELYVIVTPDWLIKAKNAAPNAIAWDSLIADFDAMGGSIPTPNPTPVPTPPVPPKPTPVPPPAPVPVITDKQILWDVTTSVVTVPTGITTIASNLPAGVFFPGLGIVLLPSGWSATSADKPGVQRDSFDFTTLITFVTTNLPAILQLIQSFITIVGTAKKK